MAKTVGTYDRAVGLLALRDHSEAELRRKLRTRECPEGEVEEALKRLRSHGYLDDVRLAPREVRRLVLAGRGPLAIRQKLRQRGFASDLVEEAIAEVDEEESFPAACDEALRRKFGRVTELDRKTWQRAARFLAGRGFGQSTVRAALDRFAEELRERD